MTHERVLREFRDRVRTRRYVLTLHAEEEMNEDGFTILDVERGVLTGVVLERQRDKATRESKYVLRGKTISEDEIELVAKMGPTGKMVILTVYAP
jgi:hypothetical protein